MLRPNRHREALAAAIELSMNPFRLAPRGCLASCILLALAWPGAGRAADADAIKVHYGVSLIGLPIGSAVVSGFIEPSGYRIEASAKMTGLASIMSSSRGAATATGGLVSGHVAPASYATTSSNSVMTRTVRVAMKAGTVSGVDITPPFDPNIPRVPITEADKRNIVDPLSAFVMTVPAGGEMVGTSACNRTLPIFDGATRFDIDLTYVGTRHVKAKGYDGEVSVCSARYRPISGHRSDGRAAKYMADNRQMEAWLAPVNGSRVVFPFRISVLTMVGTVVIEADEFSIDPTKHAAVVAH